MKIIVDAMNDRILGASILAVEGGELVHILYTLMLGKLPYTLLQGAVYIHPTLAEGFFTLLDHVKPVDWTPMRKGQEQIPMRIRRLRRSELPVDTLALAQYLIGKTLVHDVPSGRLSGRIVETEAYPVGDAAGHSFGGETPSRRSLFSSPRPRLCVLHLRLVLHDECIQRNTRRGCWSLIRAVEPLEASLSWSGDAALIACLI